MRPHSFGLYSSHYKRWVSNKVPSYQCHYWYSCDAYWNHDHLPDPEHGSVCDQYPKRCGFGIISSISAKLAISSASVIADELSVRLYVPSKAAFPFNIHRDTHPFRHMADITDAILTTMSTTRFSQSVLLILQMSLYLSANVAAET